MVAGSRVMQIICGYFLSAADDVDIGASGKIAQHVFETHVQSAHAY